MFLDNPKVHPNIKLEFLPPNTTSLIQPLDQGIIKNVKSSYRKLMVKHFLSQIETQLNYQANQITILDALYWIQQAWSDVSQECIQNCFRHAGFIEQKMIEEIQTNKQDDTFQFYEQIILQIHKEQQVELNEFVNFDSELAISIAPTNSEELTNLIFNEYQFQQGKMIEEDQNESEEEIDSVENILCPTFEEVTQITQMLKVYVIEKESSLLFIINKLQNLQMKLIQINL